MYKRIYFHENEQILSAIYYLTKSRLDKESMSIRLIERDIFGYKKDQCGGLRRVFINKLVDLDILVPQPVCKEDLRIVRFRLDKNKLRDLFESTISFKIFDDLYDSIRVPNLKSVPLPSEIKDIKKELKND